MQNFFVGKCLKFSQKLHRGYRKHNKVPICKKNKNFEIDK